MPFRDAEESSPAAQAPGATVSRSAQAPPTSHPVPARRGRDSAGLRAGSRGSRQSAPEVQLDPVWGLPKVRESVTYAQLLKDIRLELVEDVRFFITPKTPTLEGQCLVVYRNGIVKESFLDQDDMRMAYAMEAHGVAIRRIQEAPDLRPPAFSIGILTSRRFTTWFGVAAVGLVYIGTYVMRQRAGDAEDREKLRKSAKEERRKRERQNALDQLEEEVLAMHRLGQSVGEMESKFRAAAIDVTGDEGESQLADEEAYRQKIAEEVSADDPNAQAEDMLKMRTVRIKRAEDPARQRRIREAQRQLRGVKLQYSEAETIFFEDVAGIGDSKVELQEVVDFFTKPARFKASGARVPRGVLLCGPPGTGKTLLARAVAGEAGVAFLSINASEFVEMFVGVGAARVRDLFSTARSMAPTIMFIDEIDSVGRTRGGAQGNDERDQTLNQLLTEMDGFDTDSQVVVMAASNRKDVLDAALVRPGRFDRIVYVDLPDYHGRIDILKVHLDRRAWDKATVDLHKLAFETRNYSGARLANLVNMAATAAGQKAHAVIDMEDMERALDMERLGPLRAPYSDVARRRLALVEGATSALATLMPAVEPVARVTIQVRETYPLGHTVVDANEQRELTNVFTRRYLQEQLLVVLAGRAIEEVVYGKEGMSTINQRRIATARRIANKMVVSNAMTDAVGPRLMAHPDGPADDIDLFVTRFIPVEVANTVDDAIAAVMNNAYEHSLQMVKRNLKAIEAIADGLMAKNTLSGDEVRALVLKHAAPQDLDFRDREAAVFL